MPKRTPLTRALIWDAMSYAIRATTEKWNGEIMNVDPPHAALEVEAAVEMFLEDYPLSLVESCYARAFNRRSQIVPCQRPWRHVGPHQHWNPGTGEFTEWLIRGVFPHQAGDFEDPMTDRTA